MKQISMTLYPRKAHFDYFNSMPNPYVGVTVNIDITDFLAAVKRDSTPFFLSFLWHVAKSANLVPEFRQRIVNDGIIEFESCTTSHTVAMPNGAYSYCTLDCDKPVDEFIPYAKAAQYAAAQSGNIDETADEALKHIFISTVPWLSYTSLVQPTPSPADSNPRITWGKYFIQGNAVLMPLTVLCNHAIVDGAHIAEFYDKLNQLL